MKQKKTTNMGRSAADIWAGLEKRFMPPHARARDPLTFWRERILLAICLPVTLLGPFALVPSLTLAVKEKLWHVVALDLAAYFMAPVIILLRNRSLRFRVNLAYLVFCVLGFGLLLLLGFVGAGYIWLFGASIWVAGLSGFRPALWSLVFNAAFLGLVAAQIAWMPPPWTHGIENPLFKWSVTAINFLLLNSLVTITIALLLEGLKSAILQEQKGARELGQSESKVRSILDASPAAIVLLDRKGMILDCNRCFMDKTGTSGRELAGKNILNLASSGQREFFQPLIREVFETSCPLKTEFVQNDRVSRISIYPIHGNDGAVQGVVLEEMDITVQKQLEKEKKHLEKQSRQARKMEAIGTLSGGIAHDFNNILAAIMGYTELALEDLDKKDSLKRNLQQVYKAGTRAKDLVRRILTFARQADEKIEPIQPGAIVEEAMKMLRPVIPSSVEIKLDNQSRASVLGNPVQTHQIITNLCTNAAFAMEENGGLLQVEVKDVDLDPDFTRRHPGLVPGQHVKLSVADTGPGIAPEILDSIFEPYFTTKGPGQGTGMGLSTVHGIVKSFGGEITVHSEKGKGARFTVYLPVCDEKQNREENPKPAPSKGREHILFVDDEPAITQMARASLGGLGYKVTTALNARQALNLFADRPNAFDLVVTDMTMPKMTGDKLAAELMKTRPGLPVILCTGYSRTITEQSAREKGIAALVFKPIPRAELARIIREVLDSGGGRGGGFPEN